MNSRVLITGLGILTARGIGKEEDQKGGIKDFNLDNYLKVKNLKYLDRTSQLALASAKLALEDAHLNLEEEDLNKVGIVLGTSWGNLSTMEKFHRKLLEKGPKFVSPLYFSQSGFNTAVGTIALTFGIKGFNSTLSYGKVSGSNALGYALDLLRYKRAEVILSGGVDSFSEILFQVKSMLNKKTTLGEGAGILVLEREEHALKRKSRIYGELAGFGTASGNRGLPRAMNFALEDASLNPENVDYIGETSEASGSIEVITSILAMQDKKHEINAVLLGFQQESNYNALIIKR